MPLRSAEKQSEGERRHLAVRLGELFCQDWQNLRVQNFQLARSPLSLCKYFVRNLFLAGPLPEATGVSGGDEEEDEVRFSGAAAAASEVRGEEALVLGGSAGSTTATDPVAVVVVVCGCEEAAVVVPGRGHERSSGCIWQSAMFILASS